jgi:DNA-binding NtrC family response regulator
MNILVVDDEAVMIESIRIGLENSGYRVFQALSARQALDQLNHLDLGIDLVATDYQMPEMNGIDLLEAIRKNHPALPVILMTAHAEKDMVIEALKNRCNGFIEKPFSLNQLVAEIERIQSSLLPNAKSGNQDQLLPRLMHQVNNPLFVISGSAELILSDQGSGEALQRQAKNIINAVTKINRIFQETHGCG